MSCVIGRLRASQVAFSSVESVPTDSFDYLASVRPDLLNRMARFKEDLTANFALPASATSVILSGHQMHKLAVTVITGLAIGSLVANEVVMRFSELTDLRRGRRVNPLRTFAPQFGIFFRQP